MIDTAEILQLLPFFQRRTVVCSCL